MEWDSEARSGRFLDEYRCRAAVLQFLQSLLTIRTNGEGGFRGVTSIVSFATIDRLGVP
jgi:hypothetical protein